MTRYFSRSPVRVIYIGGVPHNGSTLLGVALGNHREVVCAGELTELARNGWLGDYRCACGAAITDCTHWTTVYSAWAAQAEARDARELVKLEAEFDRNRQVPYVVWSQLIHSQRYDHYGEQVRHLFHALCEVTGCQAIVDTSKRVARALALARVPGIACYVIHLIRDVRAVLYSYVKRSPTQSFPWWRVALQWSYVNAAYDLSKQRFPTERYLRVRYEDFISDPTSVLERISIFTGVDFDDVATTLAQGEPLQVGHVGIGNGFLHRATAIRLRSTDNEWSTKLTPAEQQRVFRLGAPLMLRYGYRW